MNTEPDSTGVNQDIDWSEIHKRVETVREALEQSASPSPQEIRTILKARARALAREPAQVASLQKVLNIIKFHLGTETYGIESAFVREVYPLKDYTPLPGVPPFVLGILNVRGQILSIIDLKKCFGMPEKGLGQLNKLIILHSEQMEFGILADEILGTASIVLNSIQAAPPTVSGMGAEYLHGITAEGVIILDAEKILSDEKIVVHQEVG
jgi:purine-binding chemotaxis protein CheW